MKKYFLFLAATFVLGNAVKGQISRPLKKVLELKMPKTVDDDMPGTRGASVAWHPIQKKYYAVMAGNMAYPLAVYDVKGKQLSLDTLTAMEDSRGLWYDPAKKQICGNTYGSYGWFSYTLDKKGIPVKIAIDFEGMNQPDDQSVGAYNVARKSVMFIFGSQVSWYNAADASVNPDDRLTIHWGTTAKQGIKEDEDETVEPEGYNRTTVIYTGKPGAEIGFLNIDKKQVELYDSKPGFLSQVLILPSGSPAEASFNFAFTNDTYWFFDMEKRVWFGCK